MFHVLYPFLTYLLTLPLTYEHNDFNSLITESESKRNITTVEAVKFGLHIANVRSLCEVLLRVRGQSQEENNAGVQDDEGGKNENIPSSQATACDMCDVG
jgi:hypothetical protein